MERDHIDAEATEVINEALSNSFAEVARLHDRLVHQTNDRWTHLEALKARRDTPAVTQADVDHALNRASISHSITAIVARIMYARFPETAGTWFNEDDPS